MKTNIKKILFEPTWSNVSLWLFEVVIIMAISGFLIYETYLKTSIVSTALIFLIYLFETKVIKTIKLDENEN